MADKNGDLADQIIERVEERYGIRINEVQEMLAWYRRHRDFFDKLKHGGILTALSILISATALATWEGAKAYMKGLIK